MDRDLSWKLKDDKWLYTDNEYDATNAYPFATIEKIPKYENDFEINFQYVVTMIGADMEDCKRRAERGIAALSAAIPNPKKPWWKFWR